MRDKAGVCCKKCGSQEHYWLNSKQMYQCKSCSFRTGLRSGTIMEASKLPFRYWFVAIWLMGCSKKGSSACNVQRQLNHKRYEPIWAMMHKIRSAMGQRDNHYLLGGNIEVDEGFFETLVPEGQKEEERKRGRGSQKQTMAMVFAQTEVVLQPKKHRPSKRCKLYALILQ
ncbi:IS1595 family transposase [Chondrinema litorale]|uniref:IS1595 family transposase n=1 Tax=Chondrinema litorale TaxID=2994555 RepID=UPI003D6E3D82